MRVTLVSYGSEGDVRPLLALAAGLTRSGHETVLVGEESGAALASDAGVEYQPLAGTLGDLMDASAINMARFRWPDAEWVDAITRAASGSDVVVGLPAASYHAVAAADQVGATAVLGALQPMLATEEFVPSGLGAPRLPRWLNRPVGQFVDAAGWAVLGSRVNSVRRRLGHAPLSNPYHHARVLGAWSPLLVPRPHDWPDRVTITGAWHSPTADWLPTAELDAFLDAEERPLYVGFGSLRGSKVAYVLQSILHAVAGKHRVVLQAHPSITAHLPDSVLRVEAVPHDWLFPRCGALIHHAGAGTAHAAARSGVPSVPVPFMLDQPFWAKRMHDLGIASRPVDPRSGWEAYEPALRETVPARAVAQDLAARLQAEDGVRTAVTLLETLASSSR